MEEEMNIVSLTTDIERDSRAMGRATLPPMHTKLVAPPTGFLTAPTPLPNP
jgi:hypothetical protein